MLRIRYFEEKLDFLFTRALISGTTHSAIGQEAVAVGACAAIREDDWVSGNHRSHGHVIAKGLDVKRVMAELLGKKEGYCKGKGGTQHLACMEKCFLGTNGITAGGIPVATGAALSSKMRSTGQVTLVFFGDGATNQGVFHESLNFASIWKIPIIYICENNLYAMSTPIKKSVNIENLAERARSYGMPAEIVDGNDVLAVRDAVRKYVERARSGHGPAFIECKTYRFAGHSKSDPRLYRAREEEAVWKKNGPLRRLRGTLLKGIEEEKIIKIEKEEEENIEMAYEFAKKSPVLQKKELYDDLYHG
ncbi:thiamine pyrophosphate-dependent dehydrogenase E1 component subunit alpha [Candidatus Woesearchaeota archaeon]|nr:thiamine pyrophosphate-dependent dehydrogenase E1 component subunit alpha [Candidatus Woesearchaeota archaeon]